MIFNAYSDSSKGLCGVSIKSAGRIFAQKGRRINRPYGREDWLIFYIAKGSERFFFDSPVDGTEGDFVIYRPHERQEHICIGDKNAEFYYVHFIAPDDLDILGFESFKLLSSKPGPTVCDLFGDIITELQNKNPYYETVCAAKLFEILGQLARRGSDANSSYGRYGPQISFVIQNMNREFYKDYSLGDYADMCQMSKFHFLRIFKEATGQSPLEYRNAIRIEQAKHLLEDEDIPVGEIGLKVGYSSSSYFCDAFKKKMGSSPTKYRQMTKKQEV